jgi:hypothetical protein
MEWIWKNIKKTMQPFVSNMIKCLQKNDYYI